MGKIGRASCKQNFLALIHSLVVGGSTLRTLNTLAVGRAFSCQHVLSYLASWSELVCEGARFAYWAEGMARGSCTEEATIDSLLRTSRPPSQSSSFLSELYSAFVSLFGGQKTPCRNSIFTASWMGP